MAKEFRTLDWDSHKMDYHKPHERIEPLEKEIAVVGECLEMLVAEGILPHTEYDHGRLLAHREAVAELFEIPWTAITHRMQRLLYAINAIIEPQVMIAAGVFCGNTFISNAGAGAGPGASYQARQLIGLEIKPDEAERAERNVRKIDPTGVARVLAEDAVPFMENFTDPVDVLYLDADGDGNRGKGIYLEIVEAGARVLHPGSILLAHNSVNCAEKMKPYLDWVRDEDNCPASVNVILDPEGLEVSIMS